MSGELCFVCELPVLGHQASGRWAAEEEGGDGLLGAFHEDCLACASCGLRLAGGLQAHRLGAAVYCALHFADAAGLASGDEFMQKLRDYKLQSLGCAESRRKSSTTLQFPVPVQACLGLHCAAFPHRIRLLSGYWVECSGSAPAPTKHEHDRSFELISVEEDTYERHFYGTEHWNYFTNDEALGPVILTIKQENVCNRDQFRVMLRTVSYCLHGLVPASCICADRYDREDVVKSLGDEAGLKPPLTLGQLSSTPDELLKLDQVFIKTELKVGVILVKEGQMTEEQILDNHTNTPLFDEFLSVLGDRIRLKGFDKYKGGLDSVHDLTGTESVYTAWRGIEIIFHVSTLLPHEAHDPQKKKRHIGNDIVCVAFLEADDTLFSPMCIKSHFLHTFIVVRSSPSIKTEPRSYEVSVVSREEVGAYKPYLWHRSKFIKDSLFREWLLTKIVNGERASYSAPKFARMQDRTRSQMLEDIVTNLQNYVETGQIPKPYRRGSWRPIGHMRPSSPLLDGVRDTFEGFEQLARDFGRAFQNNRHLCDVIFNVGQGKEKTRVYAVRAILGVRSRVFLEMLYGFTTGYGPSLVPQGDASRRESICPAKSSNFLQVPDPHDTVRSKTPTSSPTVFRYFSRLGNWAGWGMGSRSKTPLGADGLKRWQSEFDCKEKEKERRQSLAVAEVTLSMCADAGKVDRAKLSQIEFNIIEFDIETFMILIEYIQSGSCTLTCETIPGLICAAEHYDLPELLQACFHHAKQHFRLSVVCTMLNMLENYYWRYNSASELVNAILTYICSRATQLFRRREFLDLSESMFQMILGRDLNISEIAKFHVMLRWANSKIETSNRVDPRELQCIMNRLTRDLKMYNIPPQDLIRIILPSKTISNERILETLLHQANTGIYRIQRSHIEECRATAIAQNSDFNSWDILETKISRME